MEPMYSFKTANRLRDCDLMSGLFLPRREFRSGDDMVEGSDCVSQFVDCRLQPNIESEFLIFKFNDTIQSDDNGGIAISIAAQWEKSCFNAFLSICLSHHLSGNESGMHLSQVQSAGLMSKI
ncbi:hypothetical protein MPTK1_4g05420 [Marchantia polymorpha subsp. ruderalis]|uniref:Uncharacterized protein n=2 Tax=Marchantia polymorpha TaxID=3197 RepID=A0AAF6B6M7_MARPO|nr:hypothetical protein MARPO_0087s0048 [Marchantia polymorpha]BBN07661.1 hypothetical protein Mp_4g05420 [Marchantia polymorpha subsp. ruderalis]|eukprot:PTQ33611.1 hypothetical protein MARPO_0087s0048 [Marchantia polymorpha]